MGSAIVLHHHWVIDGNVGGTLVEVCHGISAGHHDLVDQKIGLRDRALGFVDKLRLHRCPTPGEIEPAGFRQRTQGEFIVALGAHLEDAFGAAHLAFFFKHAIVFWTEALAELFAAALARQKEPDRGNYYNGDDHRDHDDELVLIHAD